jgi:outer membrane protein OmpU
VRPGGALNLTVSGFARFLVTGGDIDNARFDPDASTDPDFFNDTEFHVLLAGKHDATGIEYGARIELEGDTSRTANGDETWVYLRGGFGELRLGDEDGSADMDGAAVSAATLAAGTGGLDADVLDTFGAVRTIDPFGTSDATKIRYMSPAFAGFRIDASYTPNLSEIDSGSDNGDLLAATGVEAGEVVEGVLAYKGKLGGLGLEASVGGLVGDIKDEDEVGGGDYWALQAGAVVEVFGVSFGGSYLTERVGGIDADAMTLGVGGEIGPVDVSLNYGQVLDSDGATLEDIETGESYEIVLSADVGLMPGLTLAGDIAYFDNDAKDDPPTGDDNGWQGVARLALAF